MKKFYLITFKSPNGTMFYTHNEVIDVSPVQWLIDINGTCPLSYRAVLLFSVEITEKEFIDYKIKDAEAKKENRRPRPSIF